MDNSAIYRMVSKIPELRFKFLGVYSPMAAPTLKSMPNNTFFICNTSDGIGDHWVTFIKLYDSRVVFFGDSLGRNADAYHDIRTRIDKRGILVKTLVNYQVQKTNSLCGPYAVYIAYLVFSDLLSVDSFNEFKLLQFAYKYC